MAALRRVKLSKNNVPKMRRVTGVAPLTIGKVDYKIDYRHKLDAGPAGADYPLRPQVFVPVLVLSYLCLS